MSIRIKVILPYLLLTLLVAVVGVFVVTKLVTNTLDERLTNQLLEAGRVVSSDMTRQEMSHIEAARIIASIVGVAEAMSEGDGTEVLNLAKPAAAGLGAENLFIIDAQGKEVLHLIQRPDGGLAEFGKASGATNFPIVEALLSSTNSDRLPRRVIDLDPIDGKYYYFTAIAVSLEDDLVGVIVIGTSLDTIQPYLKSSSVADIIFYDETGQAIATTLGDKEDNKLLSEATFKISEPIYEQASNAEEVVDGENIEVDGRSYKIARGALRMGDDQLGIFAVVLPSNFVMQEAKNSRNTYVAIFTLAMIAVVAIGYSVSRLIINPLFSLVNTSQAIAAGDLSQRSGIESTDEIGELASTFNGMTARLQKRTIELEETNKLLVQMERTQASFIDVSAHELRTPLTMVYGYGQMVESKAENDPELAPLAKGILDGYDRMAEVVNSMLDVFRIDSKTMDIIPETLQLNPIILQVRDGFEDALRERKLELHLKGLETLPDIFADPDLLKKAFYHLIVNAIKYTPDGGSITVSGGIVEDNPDVPELEITVEDTGIGIASEHQEFIFEKFYQTGDVRLHSSGKTKFKGGGPGLGLAIVKGAIRAHKGRVWVESPGHDEETCPGSKFYIRLPLNEKVQ